LGSGGDHQSGSEQTERNFTEFFTFDKKELADLCNNSRDKWENLQVVHGDSQEERKYQRKKDYHDKVFQLPQQCKPSEDPFFPQKLLHEYHLHS
jgi:arylsulfatase A-like enzyme